MSMQDDIYTKARELAGLGSHTSSSTQRINISLSYAVHPPGFPGFKLFRS
jgi:hypothetical protein